MYLANSLNFASSQFEKSIQELRSGLEPDTLALWYKRIKNISQRVIPEISVKDINFVQDKMLSMKFSIIISVRVIPYLLFIIEKNIAIMPYSTGLYFRKVQELLLDSLNNYYVGHKHKDEPVMNKDELEKNQRRARKKPKTSSKKTKDVLEKNQRRARKKPKTSSRKNQRRAREKTKDEIEKKPKRSSI
ncbi:MAG: hypothetical protein ACE5SW_10040 [Nitrososphaeraceae archaeon]